MFKIGFYGGKMLPVHLGHIFCIRQAARQCQELHVILFHSSPNEQLLISQSPFPHFFLHPHVRAKILKEEFKHEQNIFIHSINAQQCVSSDMMTKNDNFANKEFITEVIKKNPDAIFSSESSYSNFFSQLYPQAQHVLIDPERENYPISGTLIRNLKLEEALQHLPKTYHSRCFNFSFHKEQ